MAFSEKSRTVIEYLRGVHPTKKTAQEIADATGMAKKSVDSTFTMGVVKKGLGVREEVEITKDDGTHDKVKYLVLTDEGLNVDLDAE